MMDGILIMDKPADFTSFDVCAKLRGLLKTKKIGHGGTLDPMATGVLPVFVGAATRACDMVASHQKRYTAQLQLGVRTDTLDCTGRVLARSGKTASEQAVREALAAFVGEVEQLPPMYSAIKVGGQKLYQLAHQGKEIERPKRLVQIDSIELLEANEAAGLYTIDVRCGKGTYIRTLIDDVGKRLGTFAMMTSLIRTQSAYFTLSQSHTFAEVEELARAGRAQELFLGVDAAFAGYPSLTLDETGRKKFLNGCKVPGGSPQPLSRVYDVGGVFLGLGYTDEEGLFRPKKLFYRERC